MFHKAFPSCLLMITLLVACTDERRFVGDDGVVQVALTEATPAAFANEEGAIYIVERRVALPISIPTDTVLADLTQAAGTFSSLPFPRLPWVERGDLEIQVDFTLSNLDRQTHEVAVTINGFNEFHEYLPGVTVIDDEPTPDFSQWERLYELDAVQRTTRTVREEEFDEMAVDLATVVNGAPNSNQVVFFENKSGSDARSEGYIPEVIPGLIGFRIGLRATEQARLVLEASVRVRNLGDQLVNEGVAVFDPNPQPFVPVAREIEE